MRRQRLLALCLCSVLMMVGGPVLALPRVVFINPDAPGNPFWDKVTQVMQAAAVNLQFSLEVRYGLDNREGTTLQAMEALQQDPPIDYLLYIYQIGQGKRILQAAEQAGVYSIIFNTDVPEQDQAAFGPPGQRFPHWLAHLVPDDQAAGRNLAAYLIEAAKAAGKPGKIDLVGFNGGRDSSAARLREAGLNQALAEYPEVELLQLLVSDWDPAITARQAPMLLRRWPTTRVIWSASDAMALGAAQALVSEGYAIGRDVLLGSVDWTDEGLQAVSDGHLTVTFGGHFMEGAWALVLAHDHAQGRYTAEEHGRFSTPLAPIDASNVKRYRELILTDHWNQVNFRQFSREVRGDQAAYDFHLERLLP